jgi:hypothetical protein
MSIANRVTKLEAAHNGSGFVVMRRYQNEPDRRACERFRAEHPDGPDPEKAATQVVIRYFTDAPTEGPSQ